MVVGVTGINTLLQGILSPVFAVWLYYLSDVNKDNVLHYYGVHALVTNATFVGIIISALFGVGGTFVGFYVKKKFDELKKAGKECYQECKEKKEEIGGDVEETSV